jgi:hypothetical protein
MKFVVVVSNTAIVGPSIKDPARIGTERDVEMSSKPASYTVVGPGLSLGTDDG